MGSVYILTNKGMPNLVKIGYTTRTAQERAKELYKDRNGNAITGVPVAFDVVHVEECNDPKELETLVHNELRELRFNPNREFFEFSDPSEAIQKLKEIHKRHPNHAACTGSRDTETIERPRDETSQTPKTSDNDVWRRWTSHFLTRYKRKTNTQQEDVYEHDTLS